jgi:hypothetical protein
VTAPTLPGIGQFAMFPRATVDSFVTFSRDLVGSFVMFPLAAVGSFVTFSRGTVGSFVAFRVSSPGDGGIRKPEPTHTR